MEVNKKEKRKVLIKYKLFESEVVRTATFFDNDRLYLAISEGFWVTSYHNRALGFNERSDYVLPKNILSVYVPDS